MTKGQRTIVALLAVVAVLLGLNLLSDPPEVAAQAGGPVRLVSVTVEKGPGHLRKYRVFRGWSDGSIDVTWTEFARPTPTGNECLIVNQCGPVTITP